MTARVVNYLTSVCDVETSPTSSLTTCGLQEYIYKGRLVGAFYDKRGQASKEMERVGAVKLLQNTKGVPSPSLGDAESNSVCMPVLGKPCRQRQGNVKVKEILNCSP